MKPSFAGFRQFFEDKVRSLDQGKDSKKKHGAKPENMIDALQRVLGVPPDALPDRIESGPIEIDGVQYNQAVWELKKPVHDTDHYVRVRMIPNEELKSTALNQMGVKGDTVYLGDTPTGWKLIPMSKLAEMLGRPFQPPPGGAPGGGGGMPPM